MPGKPSYHVPVEAKTIGKRLAEIRKSRGFTQVEVGGQLGMTQALVSDYERGKLRVFPFGERGENVSWIRGHRAIPGSSRSERQT